MKSFKEFSENKGVKKTKKRSSVEPTVKIMTMILVATSEMVTTNKVPTGCQALWNTNHTL